MSRYALSAFFAIVMLSTSSTGADKEEKPRTVWRHANGSFQLTKLGEWAERTPAGDSRFYTQARSTPDHIELRDIKNGATVRLTKTQCLIKARTATEFKVAYQGGWE